MQHYHRGERRYQRRRMFVKFLEQERRDRLINIDPVKVERWALKAARLRTTCRCLCSCWMCTSPRYFHGNGKAGLTLQEVRLRMRRNDEE